MQQGITNLMATILGAEYISCSAVSTWVIVTRPLSPSVNPTNSVARRQMSRARRASPDSAATYQYKPFIKLNSIIRTQTYITHS